jgi:predicted nuclease with TOPRIM domain
MDKLDMIYERVVSVDQRLIEIEAELCLLRESVEELSNGIENMPEGLVRALSEGVTIAKEQLGEALREAAQLEPDELMAVREVYHERLSERGIVTPCPSCGGEAPGCARCRFVS